MFSKELNGPDRVRREADREHQPLGACCLGGQRLLQALFRRAADRQTPGKIIKQAELAHQSDVRIPWPGAVAPAQFQERLAKMFGDPTRFKIFVADDISRQERQHRPDLVTGDVAIQGTVQRPYLPYLDIASGPARVRNCLGDDGLGLSDVILAQAEIKKNTIRGASGCRQTERVRSREKHL